MKKDYFNKVSFLKTYILPLFLIFLIPVFSIYFFEHAEKSYDKEILRNITKSIMGTNELSSEEKEIQIQFYKQSPVSKILASTDPEWQQLRESFSAHSNDYLQFRICKITATTCLYSSLSALFIVLICVVFSFRSQSAQLYSLSAGWHFLKIVCVIQVIGQGLLAVGLSYWITAIWFNSYIPKLIFAIAILVLIAVGTLIKAIFEKVKNDFYVEGEILDLKNSPELNSRITYICEKFNIEKPDTVVGGIDDNFFVTEQPIIVNGQSYSGKSLYVSLSLLKILSKEEADAVIAHEMAHFSGNDTLFSKKISPIMIKYQHYLEVLYEGGITLPVFYFMLFFWSLYTFSLSKLSREREFRADSMASEIISPQAIATSLAKISAYAHYRYKIEDEIFNQTDKTEEINIPHKVLNGFPTFLKDIKLKEEILDSVTPHPFDSHPSFDERLENVGIEASFINKELLLNPVNESWYTFIYEAESLEGKMWETYESGFKDAHDQVLSYKVEPKEEWEIKLVEKFFPEKIIDGKKSGKLKIDYEKLSFTDWEQDVYFKDIENCNFEENLGGHRLAFKLINVNKKVYLKTGKFKIPEQGILDIFNTYYSRYLSYLEHQKQS